MDIKGKTGELRATIHVTRKTTGKIETYELIGVASEEQAAALGAEIRKPKIHGAAGAIVGHGPELSNLKE